MGRVRIIALELLALFVCCGFLAGCAKQGGAWGVKLPVETPFPGVSAEGGGIAVAAQAEIEDETVEADWSAYFDGLTGAAVVYTPDGHQYTVFNRSLADTRRSPCSTFKIISSLVGLEQGVIGEADSTRAWSGEVFWNEEWNRDISFQDAFATSCVWYFRQVIDNIGRQAMQSELDKLHYGNADISDWEGRLNTNNNNPALTGFWIESSLQISPMEQTAVMEQIFGDESAYSPKTLQRLRQVMLVSGTEVEGLAIYGKTGTGKVGGVTVDAWFTGFFEQDDEPAYFCVYLGQTQGRTVSSAKAREIAVSIILHEFDRTQDGVEKPS